MFEERQFNTTVGGKHITIATGKLAGQAGGSVTVRLADTVLLAAATMGKNPREGIDKIKYFDFAWHVTKKSDKKALFVAPESQKPDEGIAYEEIKMVNGDVIFNIWEE